LVGAFDPALRDFVPTACTHGCDALDLAARIGLELGPELGAKLRERVLELRLDEYAECLREEAVGFASKRQEPPEARELIRGWLLRGRVASLDGDGGVAKSLAAQMLATSVVTGTHILGLQIVTPRCCNLRGG
jgi:hypothetical protein